MSLKHKNLKVTEVNGVTIIEYYTTNIVAFDSNNLIFSRGNYKTTSTKKMINKISDYYSLGWQVSSNRGIWWVDYQLENGEYIKPRPWENMEISLLRNPELMKDYVLP